MIEIIKKNMYKHKIRIIKFILICSIVVILDVIVPYVTGKYIDIFSVGSNKINIIYLFSVVLLTLKLSQIYLSYRLNIIKLKLQSNITFNINYDFISYINKLPLAFTIDKDSIYLSRRIESDSAKIVEFIIVDIYSSLINLINLIVMLAILLSYSYKVALIVFFSIVSYIIVYIIFSKRIKQTSYKYLEEKNKYGVTINEPFYYAKTIKINSMQSFFNKRLKLGFDKLFKTIIGYSKVSYIYNSLDSIISTIFSACIMIICGIEVLNGNLTIGQLISIQSYFTMILYSLGSLLRVGKRYQEFKVSYDRLKEIKNEKSISNGNLKINQIDTIILKNIYFYHRGTKVVNNFNYEFKRGNIYLIQGDNGTGKSTILNIISGILDNYEGNIEYNSININLIDMIKSREKNIAFLEQEPILIKDSIYNNLVQDNNVDINIINTYLKKLNLQNYISKCEYGLDTILDEGNMTISGGEKQKLSIIKTLLKNSDVILMDEPTSALDFESIKYLKEYLTSIKKDKIIIVVTHDKNLFDISDYDLNINKETQECTSC